MSSTYAGANSYPTSVTIPSDGDVKGAASVNVALESLADRTRYLRGFVDGSSPGATLLSPTLNGTITVQTPILGDGTHLFLSQPAETTHVLGALTVAQDATFAGNSTFPAAHTVDFNGTVHLNTTVVLVSPALMTVQAGATLQIYGIVNCGGAGHIRYRELIGANTSHAYSIADADIIKTPGNFTAPATYTIDTTGAMNGDRMRVSIAPQVAAVTFTVAWGAGAINFTTDAATLGAFVEVQFMAGSWNCIGASLGVPGSGA
jgi:hypothetical protein